MNEKELPKAYEPGAYEDDIYKKWEESGFFNPDNLEGKAGKYCNVLPPPNANGELHCGHVAGYVAMDMFGRFQRKLGKKVLMLPGKDHAGIQSQVVYEKKIKKERGISRHDLGREKFYNEMYDFCIDRAQYMRNQEKKIGLSADWSREKFTLDPKIVETVLGTFVKMYDQIDENGNRMMYKGKRVINWCPRCATALSDMEVEHEEQETKLWTFRYDKDFPFAIASTRPETKLGDTAVAVHPDDDRYKEYIGKTYKVNFCGQALTIKIISSSEIDMEFGTGALGVTPAHSMVDYELAVKNNLDMIEVINEEGKIKDGFGQYSGLEAASAREKIVAELNEQGLIEKEEKYVNNLSVCERCKTAIEPLLSDQWFVNVDHAGFSLKKEARKVVENEEIKIYPERFKKIMLDWIDNLHDWCISRQIWWGPRVPAWYRPGNVNLVLVRHAQTDWNVAHIMQGQTDIPLNEKGKEQARELKELVQKEKIDAMIVSPLQRTRQTAEIINTFGHELRIDDRLKERSYGQFEGKKTEEILKDHPEITTFEVDGCPYWIDVPTAETYNEVRARVNNFLEDLKKNYAGKTVLIVSHGDTLDMFYAILNNVPNEKAYGKFSRTANMMKFELEAEEIAVSVNRPDGEGWVQDEDTFDTWFSSGQWAYTTLGYPDGADYGEFYPSETMIMGRDILPLWSFRMIILSLFRTGQIPFRNLYFTGLVRDERGKKMSKSKGNGIDPLDMIREYGADAVRLSVLIGTAPGNDMNLGANKIAGYRNFINKLWNISRYIITNYQSAESDDQIKAEELSSADKWILRKMDRLIKEVTADIAGYNFSAAGEKLYSFTWEDLADWYIEACKFEKSDNKGVILISVLKDLLNLLHPFTPFVTEAIWREISDGLLIIEAWPKTGKYDSVLSSGNGDDFELTKNVVTSIRNARAENKVEPAQKVKAVIFAGELSDMIKSQAELIKNMRTGIGDLEISAGGEKIDKAIFTSTDGIDIYLIGAVDSDKEKARLEKEIANLEKLVKSQEGKLNNAEFVEKAPPAVVANEKEKLESWRVELGKLKERLAQL